MAQAPIQPMWNSSQANLRGMRGEVLSWNPDLPPWMADQMINNRLRAVIDRRIWAGLLVKDQIVVPDQYTTGTIACTRGSATVTGVSTAWPTNDIVSTTLSADITDLNVVIDVTPAAMTGITVGIWVTIDGGNAGEEQLLVLSITSTTFKTKASATHTSGVTLRVSSLVRQQFRVNENSPWYTVKGVSSTTSLKLADLWGGITVAAGTTYSIFLAYVTFGNDCKFVYQCANLYRRWNMAIHVPAAAVNAQDPQRSRIESTFAVVDYVPDEAGRPQYELWPRPTSAQVFPVLYYRVISLLTDDDDTPPPFVRSDVLMMGVIADALRYRPKTNKFYDQGTALQLAREKEQQFEREIQMMIEADDNIYLQNLSWQYSGFGSYGGDGQGSILEGGSFSQSHDVGAEW